MRCVHRRLADAHTSRHRPRHRRGPRSSGNCEAWREGGHAHLPRPSDDRRESGRHFLVSHRALPCSGPRDDRGMGAGDASCSGARGTRRCSPRPLPLEERVGVKEGHYGAGGGLDCRACCLVDSAARACSPGTWQVTAVPPANSSAKACRRPRRRTCRRWPQVVSLAPIAPPSPRRGQPWPTPLPTGIPSDPRGYCRGCNRAFAEGPRVGL